MYGLADMLPYLVNVLLTPSGSGTQKIPQVKEAGQCDQSPSWYYSYDASDPQSIDKVFTSVISNF